MSPNDKSWYVYIILTHRDALYTGITTDVERRFQEHCNMFEGLPNAKGAKYFRGNQPVKVIYQESFSNRSEASKRESAIKAMTKLQKISLLKSGA